MRRSLNEKGLTLIEAIVAATLLTIVVCGALLLYERGVRSWVWTEQNAEVVDNLRIAVDKVAYDVRGARDILLPEADGQRSSVLTIVYDIDGPIQRILTYKRDADGELERSVQYTNYEPLTTDVLESVYFWREVSKPALVRVELVGKGQKTGVKTTEISVRTAAYACSLE